MGVENNSITTAGNKNGSAQDTKKSGGSYSR